ncbi:MAG: alpha/beta hydrolase [Nitrospinota bacterium]
MHHRNIFAFLFLISLQGLLISCSGAFYHPTKETHIDPVTLGFSYGDIHFESSDGTKLHGWLFPSTHETEEFGTIVQFHGNAENISTHFLSMAWVTKIGYNLFTFDYRGYGRSEGNPDQEGLNQDAVAAINFALQLNETRKVKLFGAEGPQTLKLFLFGQSLGGAVLIRALKDIPHKDRINAIIVDSSFYSYTAIAKDVLAGSLLTWPFQPLAYVLISDRFSPKKVIPTITPVPLLVIHGTNDRVIPFKQGYEIHRLAKEPKYFWKIPGGSHIDSMIQHNHLYRDKLKEFLMKH